MKELEWIEELKKDFESGDRALFPPKWEFKDLESFGAEEIREQVRRSARQAQNGDLDEIWALADYYAFGSEKLMLPRNFKKAIYWYGRAAEQRSEYRGEALWRLAHCYLHSRGKNRDGKKAFEMLKALASIDTSKIELSEETAEFTASAAMSLAYCYDRGFGTEKNPEKAFAIWEEYAQKSDATACYDLGRAYLSNEYGKRDHEKAFYWTKQAAELGSVKAINNLGWCFEKGYGAAKDIQKAVEYYKTAASLGNRAAKNNLERLKRKGIIG